MPHPPFTGDYAAILKKYWGHDTFRPLQLETIESVAAVLMPTGGGKSLIYQVPALASEGVCIVITPLISLMKDQVDRLRSRRILAEAIHGGRGRQEIDRVLDNCIYGDVKFLYISPERVDSELFRMRFAKMKVSLIAVDEAHCISQWGQDFRPSYLRIADFVRRLPRRNLPFNRLGRISRSLSASLFSACRSLHDEAPSFRSSMGRLRRKRPMRSLSRTDHG